MWPRPLNEVSRLARGVAMLMGVCAVSWVFKGSHLISAALGAKARHLMAVYATLECLINIAVLIPT